MNRPWLKEPDRIEFQYRGYRCLILRNKDITGALCGYVAVPKGHPFYEETWQRDGDKKVYDLNVHGGITYAEYHQPIRHQNEGDDDLWWLGFDCAHYGDLMPEQNKRIMVGFEALKKEFPEKEFLELKELLIPPCHATYKTVDFVKKEIRSLVRQLAKVG